MWGRPYSAVTIPGPHPRWHVWHGWALPGAPLRRVRLATSCSDKLSALQRRLATAVGLANTVRHTADGLAHVQVFGSENQAPGGQGLYTEDRAV
jgi:hypothetical protein